MIYHSYESNKGFDINKMDYERGIFAMEPWWVGKPKYEKYSQWYPNEFGDAVVELDIDENVKTYKIGEQIDALTELFPNRPEVQQIIDKYESGNWSREDWQKLDKAIGKRLRKMGYKLIHYTDDPMYGDVWVIVNKDVIEGVKYPPKG